MLRVECPKCARQFQVPDEWSGKTACCKGCQERIVIQGTESIQPPTIASATDNVSTSTQGHAQQPTQHSVTLSREKILAALPAEIEPVSVSSGYLLALTVVAVLVVLLPILYLGLTLLVGYGVYWHFTHGQWLFDALGGGHVRGKGALLIIIAWAAPGVIGGILVLFMFKPLFRWRRTPPRLHTLKREDEPLLYEYVDELCDVIGAPRPNRINLAGDVNASASFLSNWSFVSNQLVLTIGLPLAAGISLRQLTGVLAHEFGHFSQFWAMRLYRLIEMANHWLERVTEERDEWDMRLEAWSQQMDLRIGWVLYVARGFVWLVRKLLMGFRYLGIFFSRHLSRQMEFDADQYEVRVAGSDNFAATSERLAILGFSQSLAERAANQFLQEGRAIDDFPQFVVFQSEEMTADQKQELVRLVRERPAPWTSTHPSDAERIARAKESDVPCQFSLEAPATCLFRDFRKSCQEFTRRTYTRRDGAEVQLGELTSVEDLITEQKTRRLRFEAARRFALFADLVFTRWAKAEGELATETSENKLLATINDTREFCRKERKAYLAHSRTYQDSLNHLHELQIARMPIAMGDKLTPAEFPHVPANVRKMPQLDAVGEPVNSKLEDSSARLQPFEAAMARRLRANLQLAWRKTSEGSPERQEIESLSTTFDLMRLAPSPVIDLQVRLQQLEWLFVRLSRDPSHSTCQALVEKIRLRTLEDFQKVWGYLSTGQYPFELSYKPEHLAEALLSHTQEASNPYLLYGDINRFCKGFWSLWKRVVGRLAEIAEKIEHEIGLEPVITAEPVAAKGD